MTRASTTAGRFLMNDGRRVKIIHKNLSLDERFIATPGFLGVKGSISFGPIGGDPVYIIVGPRRFTCQRHTCKEVGDPDIVTRFFGEPVCVELGIDEWETEDIGQQHDSLF